MSLIGSKLIINLGEYKQCVELKSLSIGEQYMNAKERNDCLYGLLEQYIGTKQQNEVYGRENSEAYTYAKGKLVGFCTAFGYEIKETEKGIWIHSCNGRYITRMIK